MAVEIIMPRLSDSMEEGTIVAWLVAEGDAITAGEPLVEVETDKATVTYESEHAGTLLRLAAASGASVPVGATIALVGDPAEAVDADAESAVDADAESAVDSDAESAGVAAAGTRVRASPLARRVAAELGVDLGALTGTGPQGRVTRADVERGDARAGARDSVDGAKGAARREALSRLQQTVARRMSESRATVPDFELRVEADMTEVAQLRRRLGEHDGPAPSVNDFIVKAAALALREFPRVNGSYRDDALETWARVNVGIAVAAPDALVVATILDADARSLGAIARSSRELAAKVRDGSIAPAELAGATFTVSNLGMFGIDSFSAVVNPPQAAILAVGALKPRAIVHGGEIVARPTVVLTLACDHRILYGADGARFLTRIRERLEQPLGLLVD